MAVLVSQKVSQWQLNVSFKIQVFVLLIQCSTSRICSVQEALTTTLCVDLSMYVLGSDGCLYRGKPKWNEVYPTQDGCSLNEDFVNFSLLAMSLECWPISWLSHCCFQKCGSNSGCRFRMVVLSRLFLSTPTVGG